MKCKSCGAPMKKGQLKCAYCGATNREESKHRFQKEIKDIDHKIEELEPWTKRVAKAFATKSGKVALAIFAGILVLLVIVVVINVMMIKIGEKSVERDRKKLDSFFQSGQYEKMITYYKNSKNRHEDALQKYEEILWVDTYNRQMEERIENLNNIEDEKYAKQMLISGFINGLEGLKRANDYIKDGAILGNEEFLETYIQKVYDCYQETYLLTDEEIEAFHKFAVEEEFSKESKEIIDVVDKVISGMY